MSQQEDDVSVFFTDGWVVNRDFILIAAKLNSIPEEYFSRCFYYRQGDWIHSDITDAVHSVCFSPSLDACFWMGQAGTITIIRNNTRITEIIGDVDRYGNLNRIRTIGDHVYACGYGGQVYRRDSEGWHHIDNGLLVSNPSARSVDLMDLDGTGPDNLFAVGTGGSIFFYQGTRWRSLDSPTNVNLMRVKCISPTEVYICGFGGTLLRGNAAAWDNLTDTDISDHFYGLESYGNSIYLARSTGLMRLSGRTLLPVEVGINRALSFNRLHANDNVLWSFGTDDLLFFDGRAWTEVLHPDNVS